MNITQRLITPNKQSRPQSSIKEYLGIVMHWTGNPNCGAQQVRDYFEAKKSGAGDDACGSAHYVVGQDGSIVQCVPEEEIAYHCGSAQKDPVSGRVYTDLARRRFGHYAENYRRESPNFCTIGIELCPTDWAGNFSEATLYSAAELCADICVRRNLMSADIMTHHDVVGWKDCPKLWTESRVLFDDFVHRVCGVLAGVY